MSFISLLQAAGAGSGSLAMSILPFVLIFAIFYFFIIRPQNKKQKDTQRMISALKKGDKVVTIGGIHGVISSTKEQSVIVKVDDNTKIEFSRSAVGNVVVDKPAAEKNEKTEKAEKNEVKKSVEEKSGEETAETEKK